MSAPPLKHHRSRSAVGTLDPKAGRGIALRIEIDDEHALVHRGERGAKVDGGRGLADPALLIGKHEHAQGAETDTLFSWKNPEASPAHEILHLEPVSLQARDMCNSRALPKGEGN